MIIIRYPIIAYVRDEFCAMLHIIPSSWDFGWLHNWNTCLNYSLQGSLEIFDTLYPLQGRIFLSRASLLALLAHRVYYVPAHCGVTCCSCFVLLLPLPSILFTSELRVHVLLLGFTTLHYSVSSLYASLFIFPSRIFLLLARTRWLTHTLYVHRKVYNIRPGCVNSQ